MTVEEFILVLVEGLKVDPSLLVDNRGVTITFDRSHQLTIELDKSSPTVYLHAPVTTASPASREKLFARALQLHMFGIATNGASFGYDDETNHLLIFKVIDISALPPETLLELINEFMNQINHWSQRLS